MITSPAPSPALDLPVAHLATPRPLSRLQRVNPLAAGGLLMLLGVSTLAVFAPAVAPAPPLEMQLTARFTPPGAGHLFGTDNFGRDVLSRVIWGSRPALLIGFASVAAGSTLGALLGLLTGYLGGWIDLLAQRVVDILMVFPALLLSMTFVAMLGPSTPTLIVAVAVTFIPPSARAVRSVVLGAKTAQYVEAARVVGCTDVRIVFRHLLPNCTAPYLVMATTSLGAAIIIEASLSFLGIGTQPPEPSWGSMLGREGRGFLQRAPWIAVFPGLFITVTVLAFNFVGDAIRDYLDPRLRGSR